MIETEMPLRSEKGFDRAVKTRSKSNWLHFRKISVSHDPFDGLLYADFIVVDRIKKVTPPRSRAGT